jgi:hypothetical protein
MKLINTPSELSTPKITHELLWIGLFKPPGNTTPLGKIVNLQAIQLASAGDGKG